MRNLWSEVVVVLQVFHASIEEEMLENKDQDFPWTTTHSGGATPVPLGFSGRAEVHLSFLC